MQMLYREYLDFKLISSDVKKGDSFSNLQKKYTGISHEVNFIGTKISVAETGARRYTQFLQCVIVGKRQRKKINKLEF